MISVKLDAEGWEVSAHSHTPMGQHIDISEADTWEFKAATLPFDAISWLHESGFGPDPVVGFNEHHYRWTEDVDWVLRKQFSLPRETFPADDELQVSFNHVDCYFDAYLNGHLIGSGRNEFREYVFDIDESLLLEENLLLLYLRSSRNVTTMMETAHGQLPAGFDTGRVHARRCQSRTGWDWTARLSSVALLTPPVLLQNLPLHLANPYVYFAHLPTVEPGQETVQNAQATVTVDLLSRRRATGDLVIRIRDTITGETLIEKAESVTIKPKPSVLRRILDLPEARLWWPLGMGEQPLYEVEITLTATDRLGASYELVQRATFGVRTATVDRTKDTIGESFVPTVNGIPIFCRGANWIPVSMLPAKANPEDYRTLLCAVVGAGMNCLRVWGGGIYETDDFYQLCDTLGVLVWQDFMFTTAAYPTYRDFLDEVEAEAVYQVTRLRNHPCLLLWCGNNENEWLHQTGDLKKGNEQKIIGETIWSHLIKQVVEEFDPSRIYHQSSPFSRNKTDYNDETAGDRHSWDGWSGWQHTDSFLLDRGRFITEFGLQAYPDIASIRQFAPGASDYEDLSLAHHQKMIEGQERIARYIAAHYKLPQDLAGWIETSQALQAEVLRRAVENWRRLRFSTAGVLIWQLHDAYPAISWSIIDYYRRPKQAWHASRHFFAPVLLSMELLIDGKPASAIPLEQWHEALADTESTFPLAGGSRMMCRRGQPPIQVRFNLINDTSLSLAGNLVVEFFRDTCDAVILDTVAVAVNPNGCASPLSHDINSVLMQDVTRMTVKATWQLDETSQQNLQALGEKIIKLQHQISPANAGSWQFDVEAGLSLKQPLVDPKYYSEPVCNTGKAEVVI